MGNYDRLFIKEYVKWKLFLSPHQQYLGRTYVWLTREGRMQRLSKLTGSERDELFDVVIPEFEYAALSLFRPNHMNYAWLGNEFHTHQGHGHLHLIPRYATPRMFNGMTFVDERWGQNYAPYSKKEYSPSMLLSIADALAEALSRT